MQTFTVRTRTREEMVEITDEVRRRLQQTLRDANATEGVCVLHVRHTTAALTVNENADPDVVHDMLLYLRERIPQHHPHFRHAEGNSDAHLKASFFGSSVTVPFRAGELLLGRWQGIYLCEFDGGRNREVVMSVIGESS